MDYLLDTSVAIDLRDGDEKVVARVAALTGSLLLSIITRLELENGVYRHSADIAVRRERLNAMLPTFRILPFSDPEVEAYGRIVEAMGYSRRKLLDRMIAAQALVQGATLVTRNLGDFGDVRGLHVLDW